LALDARRGVADHLLQRRVAGECQLSPSLRVVRLQLRHLLRNRGAPAQVLDAKRRLLRLSDAGAALVVAGAGVGARAQTAGVHGPAMVLQQRDGLSRTEWIR